MIFVRDVLNPEGPVILPDGSILIVEMHPDRGHVLHLSADGKTRRVLARTGRPNGLAVDKSGAIWVAESLNPPSLLRMTMDGKYEAVLKGCGNEKFLFPNDLAFGPDGLLYMTDSGITQPEWRTRRAEYATLKLDGRLYRIDTKTYKIEKLDGGFRFTNGLAFGPNDDLYVNETATGAVYRYAWNGGRLGKRELFGNVKDTTLPESLRGPDGMKFAANGDLYVTVAGQGEVCVLDAKGKAKKHIKLEGMNPTNLAFGLPGSKRIYVTEQGIGNLEMHEVGVDGLPLHK